MPRLQRHALARIVLSASVAGSLVITTAPAAHAAHSASSASPSSSASPTFSTSASHSASARISASAATTRPSGTGGGAGMRKIVPVPPIAVPPAAKAEVPMGPSLADRPMPVRAVGPAAPEVTIPAGPALAGRLADDAATHLRAEGVLGGDGGPSPDPDRLLPTAGDAEPLSVSKVPAGAVKAMAAKVQRLSGFDLPGLHRALPEGVPLVTYRLCAQAASLAASCSAPQPLAKPVAADVTGDGAPDIVASLVPTLDRADLVGRANALASAQRRLREPVGGTAGSLLGGTGKSGPSKSGSGKSGSPGDETERDRRRDDLAVRVADGLGLATARLGTGADRDKALKAQVWARFDIPAAASGAGATRLSIGFDGFRRGTSLSALDWAVYRFRTGGQGGEVGQGSRGGQGSPGGQGGGGGQGGRGNRGGQGVAEVQVDVRRSRPGASIATVAGVAALSQGGRPSEPVLVSLRQSPVPEKLTISARFDAGEGEGTLKAAVSRPSTLDALVLDARDAGRTGGRCTQVVLDKVASQVTADLTHRAAGGAAEIRFTGPSPMNRAELRDYTYRDGRLDRMISGTMTGVPADFRARYEAVDGRSQALTIGTPRPGTAPASPASRTPSPTRAASGVDAQARKPVVGPAAGARAAEVVVYDRKAAGTVFRASLTGLPALMRIFYDIAGNRITHTSSSPIGGVEVLLQRDGGAVSAPAGGHVTVIKDGGRLGVSVRLTALAGFELTYGDRPHAMLELASAGRPFLAAASIDGAHLLRMEMSNTPRRVEVDLDPAARKARYQASGAIGRLRAAYAGPGQGPTIDSSLYGLRSTVEGSWRLGERPTMEVTTTSGLKKAEVYYNRAYVTQAGGPAQASGGPAGAGRAGTTPSVGAGRGGAGRSSGASQSGTGQSGSAGSTGSGQSGSAGGTGTGESEGAGQRRGGGRGGGDRGDDVWVAVAGVHRRVAMLADLAGGRLSWTADRPTASVSAFARTRFQGRDFRVAAEVRDVPARFEAGWGGGTYYFQGLSGPVGSATVAVADHDGARAPRGPHLAVHYDRSTGDLDGSVRVDGLTGARFGGGGGGFKASFQSGSPAVRNGSPAPRSGSPVVRDGSRTTSSGSPATSSGSPVVRSGSLAARDGSRATSSGSPAARNGSPAASSGSPAAGSGSPAAGGGAGRGVALDADVRLEGDLRFGVLGTLGPVPGDVEVSAVPGGPVTYSAAGRRMDLKAQVWLGKAAAIGAIPEVPEVASGLSLVDGGCVPGAAGCAADQGAFCLGGPPAAGGTVQSPAAGPAGRRCFGVRGFVRLRGLPAKATVDLARKTFSFSGYRPSDRRLAVYLASKVVAPVPIRAYATLDGLPREVTGMSVGPFETGLGKDADGRNANVIRVNYRVEPAATLTSLRAAVEADTGTSYGVVRALAVVDPVPAAVAIDGAYGRKTHLRVQNSAPVKRLEAKVTVVPPGAQAGGAVVPSGGQARGAVVPPGVEARGAVVPPGAQAGGVVVPTGVGVRPVSGVVRFTDVPAAFTVDGGDAGDGGLRVPGLSYRADGGANTLDGLFAVEGGLVGRVYRPAQGEVLGASFAVRDLASEATIRINPDLSVELTSKPVPTRLLEVHAGLSVSPVARQRISVRKDIPYTSGFLAFQMRGGFGLGRSVIRDVSLGVHGVSWLRIRPGRVPFGIDAPAELGYVSPGFEGNYDHLDLRAHGVDLRPDVRLKVRVARGIGRDAFSDTVRLGRATSLLFRRYDQRTRPISAEQALKVGSTPIACLSIGTRPGLAAARRANAITLRGADGPQVVSLLDAGGQAQGYVLDLLSQFMSPFDGAGWEVSRLTPGRCRR
ncbi:hypothetical protein ABZT47_10415 [Sphaerisporangium sp. NPDC005289]|uniref:hypothetical protein n=1 Tax=Sphaerisporangium sp. NPDC005289 TaxID=3155247 RepID=UPI0033B00BF3